MAQKKFSIEGVGEILVVKRRRSRHLRISISPAGTARVSIPYWAPYSTGVNFAKSKAKWLQKNIDRNSANKLPIGAKIGKNHTLSFSQISSRKTSTRVSQLEVKVVSSHPFDHPEVQLAMKSAAERALKRQAMNLLPLRTAGLAKKHGYSYSSIKIKKLTSRWGSCNSRKEITLSYFLMQLPWRLIDYVILHELVHTVHLDHSRAFWHEMDKLLPNIKELRREARQHKPYLKVS